MLSDGRHKHDAVLPPPSSSCAFTNTVRGRSRPHTGLLALSLSLSLSLTITLTLTQESFHFYSGPNHLWPPLVLCPHTLQINRMVRKATDRAAESSAILQAASFERGMHLQRTTGTRAFLRERATEDDSKKITSGAVFVIGFWVGCGWVEEGAG
jgi:hypothetical protein